MTSSESDERDPPFWGYRERTRAVLRHLIFERRLNPCHPLVAGYDHHLYLTTAHTEYARAQELSPPALDLVALRTVCYRGADLSFRYCDRVAPSLYQDNVDDQGWEVRKQEEKERELENAEEKEGRKSWDEKSERNRVENNC